MTETSKNDIERIQYLEARVAMLESIVATVRSDSNDVDLVANYNSWTILYPITGGVWVSKTGVGSWFKFKNSIDAINFIQDNQR